VSEAELDLRLKPRFKLSEESIKKLHELLPDHMIDGMIDYWDNHLPPGDFLQAVLANRLVDACLRADDININYLRNYAEWLYWYAPGRPMGWGSEEAVDEWLKQ